MAEQLTIWTELAPKFKIMDKPIRLIELFAGIGSQIKAIKELVPNVESYKICEWAYQSYCAYNAIHIKDYFDYSQDKTFEECLEKIKGTSTDYNKPLTEKQLRHKGEKWVRNAYNNIIATHNLVDITQVKGEDLAIIQTDKYAYIMTYSFPCLTGDSMVLTENGYKPIRDIKNGDYVLTHKNRYCKVLASKETGNHETLKIKGMAFDELILTLNHKVLTQNGWKEAKDLTKKDLLGIAINQNAIIPNYNGVDIKWKDRNRTYHSQKLDLANKDFWWVIGRYIGDGWVRQQGGIIICCNKKELFDITSKLDKLFHYSICEERTVYKIHIPLKELGIFVSQFGKGASNKHLTQNVLDLPQDLLKSFIEGYFSVDGIIRENKLQCTSTSRTLIYDLGQCIAKVYKTPFAIYKYTPPSTTQIENRIVAQKPWWQLRVIFNGVKHKGYYDNEKQIIWFPISKIEKGKNEKVYDLEIEKDHSFVANSTIVHNCQDLSLAGQGRGMSKGDNTRSGLLWEVERLLEETKEKPQILVMENVPEIVNQKNLPDFQKWISKLSQLGYSNFYKVLNAKDYGIPQNRRRCFMISILGDYAYEFPSKINLKYTLQDLLETSVDKKYFLSQEMVDYITATNDKWTGNNETAIVNRSIGCTLNTSPGSRRCDASNYVAEDLPLNADLRKVGNYGNGHHAKDIYDTQGLAPTITTRNHSLGTAICDKGGELMIKNNTKKGYEVAKKGDGINISGRMQNQRGNVQKGLSQTLKTQCEVGVIDE